MDYEHNPNDDSAPIDGKVPVNAAVRDKWLAALRSGEYKQGYRRLMTSDRQHGVTFCCLGVLCDVVKDDVQGTWEVGDYFSEKHGEGGSASGVLTMGVRNLLFGTEHNKESVAAFCDELTSLNDIDGRDFKYIAEYIEQWTTPKTSA